MKKTNPTKTMAWRKLAEHFNQMGHVNVGRLFDRDPERFQKLSLRVGDIFLDYSKNLVTEETIKLLLALARELDLKSAVESMFDGEPINETENRAVLHTALRNLSGQPVFSSGRDVMVEIREVLERMKDFSNRVRSGAWKGYTGKPVSDIVNIGIGGSDLGPSMVAEALKFYAQDSPNVHFVSNVDAADILETLKRLNPETTLFMISSKSFSTEETIANAWSARQWFLRTAADEKNVSKHFVAISTNVRKVEKFGIDRKNMFRFWDFVGGRFSVWSAIGLSIACYIGFERFEQFLSGAHEMDMHFRNAPFEKNMPVILALLGVWYNNFFKAETEAVIPYEHYLRKLPAYLRQSHMESNGKRVDRNGDPVDYPTGPVVWGDSGINGQHAFFQLLHQGTRMVPATFIGPAVPLNRLGEHQDILLANFVAQTEALMRGKSMDEVHNELKNQGVEEERTGKILPYKIFEGSKPVSAIVYKRLTPSVLCALIALFEHKVFVQGIVWNIYSFDQWGVELGKQLAGKIRSDLDADPEEVSGRHDGSTAGLLRVLKAMRTP